MKKVSDALAEDLLVYSIIRPQFLSIFKGCQASLKGCQYYATQVHHKKGRGVYLLVIDTWLAVCPHCHRWIELHPARAKELNLSMDRLTDDVDLLSYEQELKLAS